jgi:hypothetical protein
MATETKTRRDAGTRRERSGGSGEQQRRDARQSNFFRLDSPEREDG